MIPLSQFLDFPKKLVFVFFVNRKDESRFIPCPMRKQATGTIPTVKELPRE